MPASVIGYDLSLLQWCRELLYFPFFFTVHAQNTGTVDRKQRVKVNGLLS